MGIKSVFAQLYPVVFSSFNNHFTQNIHNNLSSTNSLKSQENTMIV